MDYYGPSLYILYVCQVPVVILFLIEVIQMKDQGIHYFISWNLIDFLHFFTFQALFFVRVWLGDNNYLQTGILPIIKLLMIFLAFFKVLFFLRIYEKFGFMIKMLNSAIGELYPFTLSYLTGLFVFSCCFVVLGMEIDPEVLDAQSISFFHRTYLQAFRTCIGELAMPQYATLIA